MSSENKELSLLIQYYAQSPLQYFPARTIIHWWSHLQKLHILG